MRLKRKPITEEHKGIIDRMDSRMKELGLLHYIGEPNKETELGKLESKAYEEYIKRDVKVPEELKERILVKY